MPIDVLSTQQDSEAIKDPIDAFSALETTPPVPTFASQIKKYSSDVSDIDEEEMSRVRSVVGNDKINKWKEQEPVGFLEALKIKREKGIPFYGTGLEIGEALATIKMQDKAMAGDKVALETEAQRVEREMELSVRGTTIGGNIGYGLLETTQFLGELVAAIGTGGASAVATTGAKLTAKKALKKVATGSIAATALTAKMPQQITKNYLDRRIVGTANLTDKGELMLSEIQEAPAMTALKAFGDVWVDTASELTGGTISKGVNYALSPLKKAVSPIIKDASLKIPSKFKDAFIREAKKLRPNESVRSFFQDKLKFYGVLSEMGEERVAGLMRIGFGLDDRDMETTDKIMSAIYPGKDELLAELGIFSILGGVSFTTQQIANKLKAKGLSAAQIQRFNENTPETKKEAFLNDLFGQEIEEARKKLISSLNEQNFTDISFGKLSDTKKAELNKIRTNEGVGLIQNNQLVIPSNVVKHLYERRVLVDGAKADDVAKLLIDVFHSDESVADKSQHPHIQALIRLKKDISKLGFISIDPSTGNTVVKSGYPKNTNAVLENYENAKAVWDGRGVPSSVHGNESMVAAPLSALPNSNDNIAQIEDAVNPFKAKLKKVSTNFYQDYFNNLAPLEKLSPDIQLKARSHSGVVGWIKSTIESDTSKRIGLNTEITGEGLKPIIEDFMFEFKKAPEIASKDLGDYLVALRYTEDLKKRKDVSISDEQLIQSSETIDRLNREYGVDVIRFDHYAERIYEFQQRVLHLLVDGGLLVQEKYDAILKENPHYVPFRRVMDETGVESSQIISSGQGFNKARPTIKTIKGSERGVKDIFESIVNNTAEIIKNVSKNEVSKDVASLSKELPDLIKKIKPDMHKIVLDDGSITYRPLPTTPYGNVISYYENGKKHYIEVEKNLHDAMNGMKSAELGPALKTIRLFSSILRKGATTYSLSFLLRNPLRDNHVAFLQTNVGLVPFIDFGKGLFSVIKKDSDYKAWLRSGGSFDNFMMLDDTGLKKTYEELFKKKSKLSYFFDTLPTVSDAFEQATRVAIFKKAKKKGITDLESAFISREGTLDFARMGRKVKTANQFVPFLNAGIQAADKMVRAYIKNPVLTTLKAIQTITVPTLAITGYYLYCAADDDREEYLNLPVWQKDLFWNIKIGDSWIKYPKPFSFGMLFGSIPERIIETTHRGDKVSASKMLAETIVGTVQSLSPIQDLTSLIPPLLKTALEHIANYNFFTGKSVYPEYMENLEPSERYTENTTQTAVKAGDWLNMSPSVLENYVRGLTGQAGMDVFKISDMITEQIKKWNGDDVVDRKLEASDTPILNAFVSKAPIGFQSVPVQEFMDRFEDVEKKYLTQKIKEKRDIQEGKEYAKENKESLILYDALKNRHSAIIDLNDEIKRVNNNKKLDGETRAEKINRLKQKITDTAEKANEYYLRKKN